MARNWVADYVEEKKQNSVAKLTNLQILRVEAPVLFKLVGIQVCKDVGEYRDLAGCYDLESSNVWATKFKVFKRTFPAVSLEVSLVGTLLQCQYSFKKSQADARKEEISLIQIAVGESGKVQFFKGEDPFEDEYQISSALLKRVFDYLGPD